MIFFVSIFTHQHTLIRSPIYRIVTIIRILCIEFKEEEEERKKNKEQKTATIYEFQNGIELMFSLRQRWALFQWLWPVCWKRTRSKGNSLCFPITRFRSNYFYVLEMHRCATISPLNTLTAPVPRCHDATSRLWQLTASHYSMDVFSIWIK